MSFTPVPSVPSCHISRHSFTLFGTLRRNVRISVCGNVELVGGFFAQGWEGGSGGGAAKTLIKFYCAHLLLMLLEATAKQSPAFMCRGLLLSQNYVAWHMKE